MKKNENKGNKNRKKEARKKMNHDP